MKLKHVLTSNQVTEYLTRIGVDRKVYCTKEILDYLIYQHQCTVPFENLDIYDLHKEIDLNPEKLYEKIVVNHRGGYCHELNGMFCRLLEGIGFDVRPCMARVLLGSDDFQLPIEHRANLVKIEDKLYFCDVGFGGPMAAFALEVENENWQYGCGDAFRCRLLEDNWYSIAYEKGTEEHSKPEIEMVFTTTICCESDFRFMNYWTSTRPESIFVANRVVNLKMQNGHRSIDNDVYKEKVDGVTTTMPIKDNLRELLKEKFNICI